MSGCGFPDANATADSMAQVINLFSNSLSLNPGYRLTLVEADSRNHSSPPLPQMTNGFRGLGFRVLGFRVLGFWV